MTLKVTMDASEWFAAWIRERCDTEDEAVMYSWVGYLWTRSQHPGRSAVESGDIGQAHIALLARAILR